MNYKTSFQVVLISLALLISGIFYLKYFYKKDYIESSQPEKIFDKEKKDLSEGNTIKEILYESFDNNGNIYTIKSDFGKFNKEKKDEILMTNVSAQIKFTNNTFIYLFSEYAKYNPTNSDTKFYDNVELKYLDHKINSNNIDIFFTESKLEAYSNLVYKNLDTKLKADKVVLDLITKNSKIFMFDNSTVKIIKD